MSDDNPTTQPAYRPAAPVDFARQVGAVTIAEISGMTFDRRPLSMLTRNDVFFQRMSHVLAAQPKEGKTTLLRRLAWDWCDAGFRVLILSEETAEIWQEQVRLLQLEDRGEELLILHAMDLGLGPDRLLEVATRTDASVVCVDTIGNLLGINNLSNAAVATPPLREWVRTVCRERGKTLLLLHHLNDRNEISGSRAIRSIVDVLITYKSSSEAENRRIVDVRSRMLSSSTQFAVQKKNATFEVVEVGIDTLTNLQKDVYLALSPETPSTVKQVAERTKLPELRAARILRDLKNKGLAENVASSKGGRTSGGAGNEGLWKQRPFDEEDDQ